MQFAIRNPFRQLRIVTLPDDCCLIAALREMPVEAVCSDVQLSVVVPANAKVLLFKTGVLHLAERLNPIQTPPHPRPETIGITDGLLIQPLVVCLAEMGEGREV